MINYLTWDSQFFEHQIGQLTSPPTEPADWLAVDEAARRQGLDCLYLLVDITDTRAVAAAQQAGFRMVDLRYTLSLELPGGSQASPQGSLQAAPPLPAGARLRLAEPADLPALQAIARVSHTDSRFYSDAHFDPVRSAEMYAVWIASYLEEADAVALWIPEVNGEPAGYLTCRVTGDVGRIGLLGLAPEMRGMGVGTALLAAGIEWFARQGARRVNVVTQGRNLAAQRLYQRGGFRSSLMQLWFHKWYPENQARPAEPATLADQNP